MTRDMKGRPPTALALNSGGLVPAEADPGPPEHRPGRIPL